MGPPDFRGLFWVALFAGAVLGGGVFGVMMLVLELLQ